MKILLSFLILLGIVTVSRCDTPVVLFSVEQSSGTFEYTVPKSKFVAQNGCGFLDGKHSLQQLADAARAHLARTKPSLADMDLQKIEHIRLRKIFLEYNPAKIHTIDMWFLNFHFMRKLKDSEPVDFEGIHVPMLIDGTIAEERGARNP